MASNFHSVPFDLVDDKFGVNASRVVGSHFLSKLETNYKSVVLNKLVICHQIFMASFIYPLDLVDD